MAPGNTLRFSYRLSFARTAAMLVVTLAIPWGVGYIAHAVRGPVRMFGVITLSQPQAQAFFWSFCAASVLAALVALWIAFQNHKGPHHVELGATAAVLPKASVTRVMLSVPYAAIRHIQTLRIPGQQMVLVDSSVGQTRLLSNAFATSEEFARFLRILHERTRC
jgi:hypothetical protein